MEKPDLSEPTNGHEVLYLFSKLHKALGFEKVSRISYLWVDAVRKLGNSRLLKITYRTIRHWKGTMEYHKTKDIIHVKTILGHKSINNTMIYINLEQALFQTGDTSEYITRVAKTVKGVRALLEAGFEYVIEMDGVKLFRKRK